MKAVAYDHYGGPEQLSLSEFPEPTPGPREVLVLDVVGNRPLRACHALFTPQGRYVAVSGHPLRDLAIAHVGAGHAAGKTVIRLRATG